KIQKTGDTGKILAWTRHQSCGSVMQTFGKDGIGRMKTPCYAIDDSSYIPFLRHGNHKANIAMFDGHIEGMNAEKIPTNRLKEGYEYNTKFLWKAP
ncbi:MAG: hypothetical protein RBT25_08400, partial [Lentisphaeria bacterium]|nr:hypothetical protein [Lentisphaeria bacterium]